MTYQYDRQAVIRDHLEQIAYYQRLIREHEERLAEMGHPDHETNVNGNNYADWVIGQHLVVTASPNYTVLVDTRTEMPHATIVDEKGDTTYELCAALMAAKQWRENQ